jgi:CRP/FNR family cyclic AMP-dependent transcriptional regulator
MAVPCAASSRKLIVCPFIEIFGEMALIDDGRRSAKAIAATDVALVPISELQFLLLITRQPAFALEVMRVLAHRLRAANKAL